MRYLTVTEVLEIHAEVLDGHPALRDRRLLESAVARPQASAFGRDAYPDIVSKAAGLLHSLVLNHPFLDGNKRTAVLAMLVFVDMNGYQLCWDQKEALNFVLRLAEGKIEIEDVVSYLRSRIRPKP